MLLEYAAELDRMYGRNPDLTAMPLYCAVMSFKAVYDAKDMRSTGGGDVNYATDFAPQDSTLVARLREAGAIVYAKAHNAEYNGGSGNPGGAAQGRAPDARRDRRRETWGGPTCNPYDTTRETGGSSGGSGASVAANLVTCSICESTGGSCRNPGTHNGVVTLRPDQRHDLVRRRHRRRSARATGPAFSAARSTTPRRCSTRFAIPKRDSSTHATSSRRCRARSRLPRRMSARSPSPIPSSRSPACASVSCASSWSRDGPANEAIVDTIEGELEVLQSLGAELVESTGPGYTDDPAIPNMTFSFENAMAEVIPFHMPEVLSWKDKDGKPEFVVPGWDVTSREYLSRPRSVRRRGRRISTSAASSTICPNPTMRSARYGFASSSRST